MVKRTSLKTSAITAALTFFVSPAVTADSQSIAGRFSATYTKQDAAQITDVAGHTMVLSEAAGNFTSQTNYAVDWQGHIDLP